VELLMKARPQVSLTQRQDIFRNKKVVVTGGTGSFGHVVIQQLLETPVAAVTVFSRDEEKQLDMEREYKDARLSFVIGDVRDYVRVADTVTGVDIVYHAAALKIIPTCEKHPIESIQTNLIGTLNVKKACADTKVKKAIFISTDKAVKPVNVYGMSKALAERLWLSYSAPCDTIFAAVRYGNVIGSRGSIIPYYRDLLKRREPFPITSALMTRFLITLEQAIDLVFYATLRMAKGQIFVPKIPACKITDLAVAMGGKDYPTKIVGIRPGEKIDEVLISEEEIRRTRVEKDYYVIEPHGTAQKQELQEEYTSANTSQLTVEGIKELIA
jgi:UDP-N-acetylglucosamine 4,6-dehydratase